MARKAAQNAGKITAKPIDQDTDETASDNMDDALTAIAAASNEDAGSRWDVAVTRRRGPGKGAEARLFHCTIEDLDSLEERLRADNGEGDYRVRVRRDGRTFKQFELPIEFNPAEKRAWQEKLADLRRGVPIDAPAREESSGLGLSAQERFYIALTEKLAAPPAPAVDPLEMFDRVMDIFERRQGATATTPPAAVDPVAQVKSTLELVDTLKGMVGGGGADNAGEGGGGMWGAVLGFVNSDMGKALAAGMIQQFAPQLAGAPPGAAPAPARVAAPLPAPLAAPAPAAGAPLTNGFPPALNQALTYLVDQAQRGVDPKLAASWVLQNVPQTALELLDQQGGDDPVSFLEQGFPAIAQLRPWFEALVDMVLFEDETAAPPPPPGETVARADSAADSADRNSGGATGDARDAQANAKAG